MRVTSAPPRPHHPASTVLLVVLSLALLVACTTPPTPPPSPTPTAAGPDVAAAALVAAVQAGDVSRLDLFDATGADAQQDYETVVAGLGDRTPTVTLGAVTQDDLLATAVLTYAWDFGDDAVWRYSVSIQLSRADGPWRVMWDRDVIQPALGPEDRLSLRRRPAERANVVGAGGEVIMEPRAVRRIGIAKSAVPEDFATSAKRLAKMLGLDQDAYVAKVQAGGPEQFVEAITFRADDPAAPSLDTLRKIPGAQSINTQQVLAPSRAFARALLGTVGEATKEIIDNSGGKVRLGDQAGLSGLQRRYDEQLRGTAELSVVQVRDPATGRDPDASAAPSAPGTHTASPTASPPPARDVGTLWVREAEQGDPLRLSLDVAAQKAAEKILASSKSAAALVAIDPTSGAILAAANNAASDEQALATTGRFAPGSTFKIVVALALIRQGMKPSDTVSCTETITVDGYTFHNYSDYPPGHFGTITLADAIAYSCNTAFIRLRTKVSTAELRSAAASLGMGTDYDVGFPSFFGSIPDDKTKTGRGAAMIGQGQVLASPMAMASVAASVAAGKTVVANLVDGHEATFEGKPLTASEAKQLRELMHGVVTRGSGARLAGLADGAKTGTAEYGTGKNIRTHSWMIAYSDDVAVAVFVHDGATGSGVAGPLLQKFLEQIR